MLGLLKPSALGTLLYLVVGLGVLLSLNYFGFLTPLISFLDSEGLTLHAGDIRVSLYGAIKALFVVVILFWLAGNVSDFAAKRIKTMKKLKTSNKALVSKAIQVSTYAVAFLVSLDVVGIDLTALTVFGGALGIGIGFGLQKITSNFISGLILLFEKSVEIDDLIELQDGTYGFVRETGSRYTLIETFDTKEIMIPNEDFITSRVVNWTYTNSDGRIEIKVGVSYDSDIELARTLMLDAAAKHLRCAKNPPPACHLDEFGDSSVNFILYFWVEDVTLGRMEPKSDVMRAIWHSFAENNISIPFPQRDLHIKSGIAQLLPMGTDQ
jgi:small-conductance mechanosensitive channel